MRCLLNEKKILSIKSSDKRQDFWDTYLPGFGLRVAKGGQKTFCMMCRDKGKQRRITLGRYPACEMVLRIYLLLLPFLVLCAPVQKVHLRAF